MSEKRGDSRIDHRAEHIYTPGEMTLINRARQDGAPQYINEIVGKRRVPALRKTARKIRRNLDIALSENAITQEEIDHIKSLPLHEQVMEYRQIARRYLTAQGHTYINEEH